MLRAAAHGSVPAADVLVGGTTAQLADVRASYDHDLAIVLPAAAVVILLILAWFLRSPLSPAYVLAVVALGFGASLGGTVAAFQGVVGAGGLDFTIPVVLYLFVVAIGRGRCRLLDRPGLDCCSTGPPPAAERISAEELEARP